MSPLIKRRGSINHESKNKLKKYKHNQGSKGYLIMYNKIKNLMQRLHEL